MAATAIDKQPSGTITLLTADGAELKVDKELLCSSSKCKHHTSAYVV